MLQLYINTFESEPACISLGSHRAIRILYILVDMHVTSFMIDAYCASETMGFVDM